MVVCAFSFERLDYGYVSLRASTMPTSASPQSNSWFSRVQRWLGLDDDDDASECPCAVAARIERAAAQARAERAAGNEAAKLLKSMRKRFG
jgi:hypothetical protein